MKSNAAQKILHIDDLDPRHLDPERVLAKVKNSLDRGEISLKEIERFTSFATSTLSQLFNDKYEGDREKILNSVVRFWRSWIAKNSILHTAAAQQITQLFEICWKRKLIGLAIGDNGRGKSTAAQSYCAINSDRAVYLVLDESWRLLESLDALGEALGIESQMTGPASLRKAAIIRALQRKPKLIVIDEGDEIKPRLLSVLRTIYGDQDGRCGIVVLGTTELEKMLRDPRNHLRYFDTRVAIRQKVSEMDDNDARKLVEEYDNDLERADIKQLCEWANHQSRNRGGMRALRHLMNLAQDIAQSSDKKEIDLDCIDAAKGMM
ncbi:MAG: AAA family ATPase [Bacteroidota bacterium]